MTPSTAARTTPYLNDASKILPLTVNLESRSRNDQLLAIVAQLCPFMSNNKDMLQVSQLSGGLSNTMFVITSLENDKEEVLVRIQSSTTSSKEEDTNIQGLLVNLQEENRIMAWLSAEGMAPTYFGRFENGRVEEFYSGYTPLQSDEMHLYSKQVASLLAALHKRTPPTSVLDETLAASTKGQCWTTIPQWIQLAKLQQQDDESEDPLLNLDYLQHEFTWLQRQLTTIATNNNNNNNNNLAIQYCREVVFCHMDAQSLNLLVNKEKDDDDIKLIDYEYASWNPRAADLANTFCEYCNQNNLQALYKTQYPTPSQQEEFLQAYLYAMGDADKFEASDYSALCLEINKHALLSHLLWTVWSIVQSKLSDIEFDYLAYARQRMQGYQLFKEMYYTNEERNEG